MSKLNKEKVRDLYLLGLTAFEISQELEKPLGTIKMCIQRNFKNLNDKHQSAKRKRSYVKKEVQKATDYEANKWLSDKSFMLKNRSIYRTKENGDIVLKKNVDYVVPWDVPRIIRNEV